MKKIVIFILVVIPFYFTGQDNNFFFEELSLWPNVSIAGDNNTLQKAGFGLGLYKYIAQGNVAELYSGFEYDMVNEEKKAFVAENEQYRNVLFNVNEVKFPLGVRLFAGKKRMFVVSGGIFASFVLSYGYDGMKEVSNGEIEVGATINSYMLGKGTFVGAGINWDMQSMRIIIAPEYVFDDTDLYHAQTPLYLSNFRLRINLLLKK